MPGTHAKLSASGAKKWLSCPLSASMESKFPDTQSEYASEGTTAHALGEAKIRRAVGALTRVQYHKAITDLKITEDMEEYTDGYCDYVIERLNAAKSKTPDAILKLEQKLDFSEWVPEGFGTGDVVIIADKTLEVIDLKYGQGVKVSAMDNPQLKLYALGAITEHDYLYGIKDVIMTIYQPRIDNIDSVELTTNELYGWGESIKKSAQAAFDGVGECVAGKHCDEGFCKARPVCRAYADERSRLAAYDFRKPMELTEEEISEIIDLAERLSTWSKLVKEYALDQALNHGRKFPGFKVVEGRSNRAYGTSDEELIKLLAVSGYSEDDIAPREVLGITKMEKFLGKKTFNELLKEHIIKPAGKPTIVPTEDSRPEWNSAVEDFKKIIIK